MRLPAGHFELRPETERANAEARLREIEEEEEVIDYFKEAKQIVDSHIELGEMEK